MRRARSLTRVTTTDVTITGRILALDAALANCAVGVVAGHDLVASRLRPGPRGHVAALAAMVNDVLAKAGTYPAGLACIAVTVGPGSFTGLRAALALAHGIGIATGRPVIGVTLAEVLASSLPNLRGRDLWTAIDSRRGRVFLDRGEGMQACPLDELPHPAGPVAIAGDAAVGVAARLAARGNDVMLTDARQPAIRHVALVASRRLAGTLPPCPAEPLYVDEPEARRPQAGRPGSSRG